MIEGGADGISPASVKEMLSVKADDRGLIIPSPGIRVTKAGPRRALPIVYAHHKALQQ
jgi:Mn-dependent DtxR family transcriptional regulator